MKKIAAVALLSAVVSAPAFAADEGFYAGITLGSGKPGFGLAGATKTSQTIYGGLLGYQLNKNFAVEGAFTGVGEEQTAAGKVKADAFAVTAVGILPINNAFQLYGKLGASSSKSASGVAGATNATRTGITYGIGAEYSVTPAVAIRAGVDVYPVAYTNAANTTVKSNGNVMTVGAVFKF